MITATYVGDEFTIDKGSIVGTEEITRAYNALSSEPIGPSEGDPDMVMFNRLFETLIDVSLINYVPAELNEDVVY